MDYLWFIRRNGYTVDYISSYIFGLAVQWKKSCVCFLDCQLNLSAEMCIVTSTPTLLQPEFYKRSYTRLFRWRFVIWPSYEGNLLYSWKEPRLFILGVQNDTEWQKVRDDWEQKTLFLMPSHKSRFAKKKKRQIKTIQLQLLIWGIFVNSSMKRIFKKWYFHLRFRMESNKKKWEKWRRYGMIQLGRGEKWKSWRGKNIERKWKSRNKTLRIILCGNSVTGRSLFGRNSS